MKHLSVLVQALFLQVFLTFFSLQREEIAYSPGCNEEAPWEKRIKNSMHTCKVLEKENSNKQY